MSSMKGIDGFWKVTPEIGIKSLSSLRDLVAGLPGQVSTEDYYFYSGGILTYGLAADGTNTIDLMVYHGPHMHAIIAEHSICRYIFRCHGNYLTLCLADDTSKTRPTYFGSTETPRQSITFYMREDCSDVNAVPELVGAEC